MVQMGVGQQQKVNLVGRHRRRIPVPPEKGAFLKQPAVDEQTKPTGLQKVTRASYLSIGTNEL
jgi:hypothetical protein